MSPMVACHRHKEATIRSRSPCRAYENAILFLLWLDRANIVPCGFHVYQPTCADLQRQRRKR